MVMTPGSGGARAAESVDLRGYGRIQASIAPQRSEFSCESDAKADILLGKLLADLFWDAGAGHVARSVKAGSREVVVHLWPPYGALVAGRSRNRVLVLGGTDEQDAIRLAGKEPLLASAVARFKKTTLASSRKRSPGWDCDEARRVYPPPSLSMYPTPPSSCPSV